MCSAQLRIRHQHIKKTVCTVSDDNETLRSERVDLKVYLSGNFKQAYIFQVAP